MTFNRKKWELVTKLYKEGLKVAEICRLTRFDRLTTIFGMLTNLYIAFSLSKQERGGNFPLSPNPSLSR